MNRQLFQEQPHPQFASLQSGGVGGKFLRNLPYLALFSLVQGVVLGLCVGDVWEVLFGYAEAHLFYPLAAMSLSPLFIYLNWDCWRPGKRALLLFMALGIGILFLLLDAYAYWVVIRGSEYIAAVVAPLGLALFLILPFFRQRLVWDGNSGLKAEYNAKDETPSKLYSGLPAPVRAWLPEGRFYLEEICRQLLLLFAAFLATALAGLFGGMVALALDSSYIWHYYGNSYLKLFLVLFVGVGLSLTVAGTVAPLTMLQRLPFVSHWMQKIIAWSNFGFIVSGLFVLLLIPVVFFLEGDIAPIFFIGPITLVTLIFTASFRVFGPMSQPVCARITRIASFLPLLLLLACLWQTYHWLDDEYFEPVPVILLLSLIPLLLVSVVAAVAAIVNSLYDWISLAAPLGGALVCLVVLLMLTPALSPDRIGASFYAAYLVEHSYDDEYAYSRLSYYYGNYGRTQLEELARRPGGSEKDEMIRKFAQAAIDEETGQSQDEYEASYREEQARQEKAREELLTALRAVPVWPQGRIVPEDVIGLAADYSSYDADSGETDCSRFFVADFSLDGLDDVMYLSSARGHWNLYEALSCVRFDDGEGEICGDDLEYYQHELQVEKRPHSRFIVYRSVDSGHVPHDLSGAEFCRELENNLAKGIIAVEPPKARWLNLRIGDMIIESGRY